MFTIIYPMFERGHIMKKELLLALRDYSYGAAKLQFSDWTDGIISGCNIAVTDTRLTVEPGILKFNRFVYMLTEPQHVHYEPTEQTTVVKVRFSTTAASATDIVRYAGRVILDPDTVLGESELEICRFKLKQGSRLRNDYTGFDDIQTEFDTVNLAHATWAGPDRPGVALPILRAFAKEAIKCWLTEPWDISFCTQAIAGEMVHRSVLEAYLEAHGEVISGAETNEDVYYMLERVLRKLKANAKRPAQTGRKRHQIVVD